MTDLLHHQGSLEPHIHKYVHVFCMLFFIFLFFILYACLLLKLRSGSANFVGNSTSRHVHRLSVVQRVFVISHMIR